MPGFRPLSASFSFFNPVHKTVVVVIFYTVVFLLTVINCCFSVRTNALKIKWNWPDGELIKHNIAIVLCSRSMLQCNVVTWWCLLILNDWSKHDIIPGQQWDISSVQRMSLLFKDYISYKEI